MTLARAGGDVELASDLHLFLSSMSPADLWFQIVALCLTDPRVVRIENKDFNCEWSNGVSSLILDTPTHFGGFDWVKIYELPASCRHTYRLLQVRWPPHEQMYTSRSPFLWVPPGFVWAQLTRCGQTELVPIEELVPLEKLIPLKNYVSTWSHENPWTSILRWKELSSNSSE